MELTIFARFHVRAGEEALAAAILRDQTALVRTEPGCLAIEAYGSVRDPCLFHIHARWRDAEAFETHAELPATTGFIERLDALLDQPREVTRSVLLG